MNKINAISLILAYGVFFQLAGYGHEDASGYDVQYRKAHQVIDMLNDLYKRNGFATRASFGNFNLPSSKYSRINKCQAWVFGDFFTSTIRFKVNSDDVIAYWNWSAINSIEGAEAALYTVKPSPKWSKEKAAELAEECASVFFPDMAKVVKLDRANFSVQTSGSKYQDGKWTIVLRRVSQEGYPFCSDYINVDISERYGPLLAVMRIPSNFQERVYHPMTEQQATIAAGKALKLFLTTSVGSSLQHASTSTEATDPPKLQVVNPVDNDAATLEEYVNSKNVNATLAWVTGYRLETPAPQPTMPDAVQVHQVYIYIDAEDGHLLGAEF